jgi:hypothetical protein
MPSVLYGSTIHQFQNGVGQPTPSGRHIRRPVTTSRTLFTNINHRNTESVRKVRALRDLLVGSLYSAVRANVDTEDVVINNS